MKYLVFHGRKRIKMAAELGSFDVVVTTYHTVLSEWRRNRDLQAGSGQSIYNIQWRRVILDEGKVLGQLATQAQLTSTAHTIRESSTLLAQATFALSASRRWCVTGTPIQNRLTDLSSLFRFLGVHPFSDPHVFKIHVTQSWKKRLDPQAVARLKTLVNSITLRRPKDVVDLPKRKDEVHHLAFSNEERKLYKDTVACTIRKLDAAIIAPHSVDCFNALQWINTLRLICNHGLSHSLPKEWQPDVSSYDIDWTRQRAQLAFDSLTDAALAYCSHCKQDLSANVLETLEFDRTLIDEPRLSEGLRLLCSSCSELIPNSYERFLQVCHHLPRCLAARPSSSVGTLCLTTIAEIAPTAASTKIHALLVDLSQRATGEKR